VSATVANINAAMASLPPIVIILAIATAFVVVKLIQRHRHSRRHPRRNDHCEYL